MMKNLIWNVPDVVLGGTMNKEYIWKLEDLKKIKKNGLKVFSCFACGGGSTMGYKLAGFDVIGCNEIDPKMNAMYVKNHHPKYNFNTDIRDLINRGLPDELYNLDILDGSPPCSVFSMAGKREKGWGIEKTFREGQKKQRLDDLFFYFIDLAKKLKPKVIVAENVKGLIFKKARGYVNEILKRFDKAGYDVQIFLLNSAKMGVPQRRERTFFIARRKDLKLPKMVLNFSEKPITYGEFKDTSFKLLHKGTDEYKYWHLKKSSDTSLRDAILRETGKNKRFNEKYIKDNMVCGTIVSKGKILRFDFPAKISNKDIITIQTFPQDYNFCGQNVQYVCGMSVPPIMMKKLAEQIYLQIFKSMR